MVKDIVGASEGALDLTDGACLGHVFDVYADRFPTLSSFRSSIMLAHNQEFATASSLLSDGDEIAFLPPVSGGTGPWIRQITIEPAGHFFGLTRQTIDAAALGRHVLEGVDGALCTFEGVVRNNTKGRSTRYLEYECYEDMAIKLMAQIGQEIAAAHAISRIAMAHRLGRMEIGEASVVIVATAPHRRPSFDATLEGINRLKKTVPIWKKEFFADGEVWVDGEWDDKVLSQL